MTSSKTCSRLDILNVQSGKKQNKKDQPWWLGELWLAGCWNLGPMRSVCLWLEDRSIFSCWGREKQEDRKKKTNNKELFRTLLQ